MAEQELRAQIQRDLDDIRSVILHIASAADFDLLMLNILDPYVQREVRKLLIPLLPFPYDEENHAGA